MTRASITAYNTAFPATAQLETDDDDRRPPLPFKTAARLLGLTRPALSHLVTSRQIRAVRVPGSRHVYISHAAAVAWATRQVVMWPESQGPTGKAMLAISASVTEELICPDSSV